MSDLLALLLPTTSLSVPVSDPDPVDRVDIWRRNASFISLAAESVLINYIVYLKLRQLSTWNNAKKLVHLFMI